MVITRLSRWGTILLIVLLLSACSAVSFVPAHTPSALYFLREFRRISRTVASTLGLISSVISNSFVFPVMTGNPTLAFYSHLSHRS